MSGPSEPEAGKADGISRRIAALFVDSKLTPLIIVISLALGAFSIGTTPREQDPTISVPAVAVTAAWPGHSAEEVDERLGRPISAWMREIETLEHVSSASADDGASIAVQFKAGLDVDSALSRVNDRLAAHAHELPPGVRPSIVSQGSADVPVLNLVFWSEDDDTYALRRTVREIGRRIEQQPNVSTTTVTGGARRQLDVRVDPARLAANGMSADAVVRAISASAGAAPVGSVDGPDGSFVVRAGLHAQSASDVANLVLGVVGNRVVEVGDVAEVHDSSGEPASYVSYAGRGTNGATRNAVVLSVQKVVGSNATDITHDILQSLEHGAAHELLPANVHYTVSRDDGEVATEKVQTLLEHMLIATVVVVVITGVALGRRAALIVGIVIPVTLAFVPFVYKLTGYTLNRITLAAMIFSIGILVDDAIVIVENVHRHYQWHPPGKPGWVKLTLNAVQEVGSPTILATLTVIAALAPTAFTGGMTGQFLRPLPIGASVAMLYSLFIALTLTPFLAYRLLRPSRADALAHAGDAAAQAPAHSSGWQKKYVAFIHFLLGRGRRSLALMAICIVGLLGVGALFATRLATFKNMPVSDVDTLGLVVDFPPGTTLETTHRAGTALARELLTIPEVAEVQTYSGIGGPLTFQGLARGYAGRTQPHQSELQIQLSPKRDRTSHAVSGDVRELATRLLRSQGARLAVVEEPMGPPVQAALVAEVYAPTAEERTALAASVRAALARTPGVVDVDWSENPMRQALVVADSSERLTAHRIPGGSVVGSLRTLLAGQAAAELSLPGEPEPVPIFVQAPRSVRSTSGELASIPLLNTQGRPVLTGELSEMRASPVRPPILRKDLLPVVYVMGEMAGDASALYAMMDLSRDLPREEGVLRGVDVRWDDAPPAPDRGVIRWGGEWTPTYEMNRDLGIAFVAVLFLIYVLLAAWYESYLTPFVVMLPIPLALLGVVPAHVIADMPMSGMGTIGIIALAGLMVRNSILIVDFAREKLDHGRPLGEAIAAAAEERVRPILLTAATVVCGDGVLFFDPLLQGLGLTMASGALVSTILTLLVVPVAYYWMRRLLEQRHSASAGRAGVEEAQPAPAS